MFRFGFYEKEITLPLGCWENINHFDVPKEAGSPEYFAKICKKLAADGTHSDQYNLAMSKILMSFLASTPEVFTVPLQCMQIGEFTIYESLPGSAQLQKDAGYIMADKLISMKK